MATGTLSKRLALRMACQSLGSVKLGSAGHVQPVHDRGNKAACPPILKCAMYIRQDDAVGPWQERCQHDGSTDSGPKADQRDPQRAGTQHCSSTVLLRTT